MSQTLCPQSALTVASIGTTVVAVRYHSICQPLLNKYESIPFPSELINLDGRRSIVRTKKSLKFILGDFAREEV